MNNNQIQECITECWKCRDVCQETLYTFCLAKGGNHVEEKHVKLMTDCIEICQVAADFMTRQSNLHTVICAACSKVCEDCARSCEEIGGEEMEECAKVCRKCAETCRKMSKS